MRNKVFVGTAVLAVLLGALSLGDLIFFTDLRTGFTVLGPMWIRYGVLFLGAGLCLVPLAYRQTTFKHDIPHSGREYSFLLLMFVASAFAAYLFISVFTHKNGILAIVKGSLFGAFAIYCLSSFLLGVNGNEGKNAGLGVLCSLGFYFLAVERFLSRTSSLYRFEPTLGILSSLAALLFITVFLKAVYYPPIRRPSAQLAAFGQLAFLLCTCLEMPHSLYLLMAGAAQVDVALQSAVLGAVGVLGITSAHKSLS